MANIQFGTCINFGNCSHADSQKEIIILPNTEKPICPECGQSIFRKNKSKNKLLIKAIYLFLGAFITPIIVISLLYLPTPIPPKPIPGVNPVKNTQDNQAPISIWPPNTTPQGIVCTIKPITIATKPNWYAVIEIGAKGIKSIAVKFSESLEPKEFDDKFGTQDVTPSEEISLPLVVNAICDNINQFHEEYGNLPIYLVGSSSMALVTHRIQLEEAIYQTVNKRIEFITAEQEASYLGKGIWANPNLPTYRHCESAVLDIGGRNIKGGYIENCDATVREGKDEKFASFEVPNFGVVKFTAQAQQKLDSKASPTFIEAAKKTREALEAKLDEQIRTRPELTNGKKRFYLAGGAVWIMNTLLCLDCPQYDHRSATDNQDRYTVIKPSDIDEFYRYVTTADKDICDFQKENPYLRKDRDGGYAQPWSEMRIEKQKAAIQKVCKKFKVPEELNSAAEILQALKNKMDFIHPNTHIFFMQNNLYTWSRQYLIEKIQQNQIEE